MFLTRLVVLLLASSLAGCGLETTGDDALFVDSTEAVGIDFVHFNGMSGELYFSEVVGAGVALFDADGDGDLDLYLLQGKMLGPGKTLEDALAPPASAAGLNGAEPFHDRLYLNRLVEDGELRFEDATASSGLEGATGYGMGVAAGDFDNDGLVDLYVTNAGPNQLWRNLGGGRFEDVTAASGEGLDDPRWSTSAAFLDADRDGRLDLYVTNYVDYRPERHKGCLDPGGAPEYCGPHSYRPETDRLFRNRGDGTFEDISSTSGISTEPGSGLGVVTADFNGDRWIDVYVANDLMRNILWLNQGDGTFRNEALLAGAAVGINGQAEASMGVDAGDVDNDGDLDLFMTHLDGETNTLYLNDGAAQFQDATVRAKLSEPSRGSTGFGTAMLDVDNDGWLDLAVVNGAVKTVPQQRSAGDVLPLKQVDQLFLSDGGGGFVDVSSRVPAFAEPDVSRGLAFGDVDNDGDVDLLVSRNHGPPKLLLNQTGQDAEWLGLHLTDGHGRAPQGATVRWSVDGRERARRAGSDASFCSARDPRVVLGLADDARPVSVVVDWPSGRTERFENLSPRSYHELVEGSGLPADDLGSATP